MKTLILTAIRCSLTFTAATALSLAYPASVQAVPTTYKYTGNPFTVVTAPYTTTDFVKAMFTLAGPLGVNMPLTNVTPTAFTFSDGVQTLTNLTANSVFQVATGAHGQITRWQLYVYSPFSGVVLPSHWIETAYGTLPHGLSFDEGVVDNNYGLNQGAPGIWTVAETGSTLSLMTMTLLALGRVARRFKRAAA